MRILLRAIAIVALVSLSFTSTASSTPQFETQEKMLSAYQTFRELQKYMVDENNFKNDKSHGKISGLLHSLEGNFHELGSVDSKYRSEPGFAATLDTFKSLLDDVVKSFDERRKSWAFWRLKAASSYCLSCHMSHGIGIEYSDASASLKNIPNDQRADFLLATRQFDKAKVELLRSARAATSSSEAMSALRKWLMIYIKVDSNPREALSQLHKTLKKVRLVSHDSQEAQEWIKSLRRWINESPSTVPELRKAENLLRQSMTLKEPLYAEVATVEVLRATRMLDDLLFSRTTSKEERQEALYLLGFAYSKLPAFLINELPEFFLEQCIREFPGSKWAKSSFKLYKELIEYGYTGSSGMHLPGELQLKLDELYKLSHGIVDFSPSA